MAYGSLRDMLTLAAHLQASSLGLTIADMMELTERSRATVERMLGTLHDLGLTEAARLDSDPPRAKRWRLKPEDGGELLNRFQQLEPG